MYVLIFSTSFIRNTFHCKEDWARYDQKLSRIYWIKYSTNIEVHLVGYLRGRTIKFANSSRWKRYILHCWIPPWSPSKYSPWDHIRCPGMELHVPNQLPTPTSLPTQMPTRHRKSSSAHPNTKSSRATSDDPHPPIHTPPHRQILQEMLCTPKPPRPQYWELHHSGSSSPIHKIQA